MVRGSSSSVVDSVTAAQPYWKRLAWPERERDNWISGFTHKVQMLWYSKLTMVPFWFRQVLQHSRCLPALSELPLLCQEQGSLLERQTVGLAYANTPHSHSRLECPWGLNARWRARVWLLALCHNLVCRCATVSTKKRPKTCAFVLWCNKLRGSKSPEKAFSSSLVTRVQAASSRLINSSNELWLFNTYRWNGASSLAALFHIMRTLQIAQLWLKHVVLHFYLSIQNSCVIILKMSSNCPKPEKSSCSPSECRVLSHSPPPLSQGLGQTETSDQFSSKISILCSCWMIFGERHLTTYLLFNRTNGQSEKLARFRTEQKL